MSLQHSYQALAEQEWIDIPTGWLQGRTIYGGLVAGLMMQKALWTMYYLKGRVLMEHHTIHLEHESMF